MDEIAARSRDPHMNAILILERYFLWAQWMKEKFVVLLEAHGPNPEALGVGGMLYMSHWLAALHVVTEGWNRLKKEGNPYAQDAEIDSFLKSENVRLLEDFRNAVYHFHPEYFSTKFKSFLRQPENIVWARRLHVAFEKHFDSVLSG